MAPATPWDLLYISDSSGWGVPKPYAELASKQLGRPVRIIYWQEGGLRLVEALEMVEAQPEVVAGAEIVVLWGNPENLPIKPGHHNCVESSDRPAGISDPGSYTVSDWAPFADAFGRTLDAIWKARQNQPTIVRVTDLCVPVYRDWKRAGIFDACLRMWEAQSAAIREAAEQHGAVMVSAFDVYNGKNHDEDPVTKGLIQEDGIHPSQAGGRAMAEALAAAGFTPTRR